VAKFQKGVSGNPGGRPQTRDIREALRGYTDKANKRLGELIGHKNPRVALLAIQTLYDRVFGKPLQASEITIEDNRSGQEPQRQLTAPEVLAQMGALMAQTEKAMGIDPVSGLSEQERLKRIFETGAPIPPDLYRAWQMWRQTTETVQ
jgi:hypothetical protein